MLSAKRDDLMSGGSLLICLKDVHFTSLLKRIVELGFGNDNHRTVRYAKFSFIGSNTKRSFSYPSL